MANPAGGSETDAIRLDFDRRLILQFCGSVVSSGAGLLAYRVLDDALELTALAGEMLADARTRQEWSPCAGRLAAAVGVWPSGWL